MKNPRSIVITGASSGIGMALALEYAAPGVTLALTGCDPGRLNQIHGACIARGAAVTAAVLDVRDRDGLQTWLLDVDGKTPVDLVIANAGISAGTGEDGETESQARAIFSVNVDGVLNTVYPLLEPMIRRGRGQVAIMSSLASFRGFPGAPAYCAGKAAVRVWGESLRVALKPRGIGVSVICPGFVDTRMTAVNRFPMPFLIKPEQAAVLIRRRLSANQGRIAFPWPMALAARILTTLPAGLTDILLRATPPKAALSPKD
ncbi:MAG: SDR family NAD(P)-dependent oxidoreductase [Pseudomonadota bacterium]|nr:SDR family NAD(P)-dependent oxidoreductase [Pseudomonadota bacterium]